jgi:predicted Zn-dependent protease
MSKTSTKAPQMGSYGSSRAAPTIVDLRAAIARALEDGSDIGDLRLRVTRRHEAEIKRSPEVQLDEVSFKDGVMAFLGVKVLVGQNDISFLDLNGAETEAAEVAAAEHLAANPVKKKKAPAKPRAKAAPKEPKEPKVAKEKAPSKAKLAKEKAAAAVEEAA